MFKEFTAQYLSVTGGLSGTTASVQSATLIDNDLFRDNTVSEFVTRTGGTAEIFNGFTGILPIGPGAPLTLADFERRFDDGEISTTLMFKDGTSLSGVLGLVDTLSTGPYGEFNSVYLFDQQALASVGKTIADVANVGTIAYIDHNLRWSDFGFTATGVTVPDPVPVPEPEPEPVPQLNLVQGTAGKDRLTGTAGDDLIRGGDGNDRLTGGAGADTFVFGADARDGNRDNDTITDFNAAVDTILFEVGATIRFIEQRGSDLFIQLEGDRDSITVLNADRGIVANFEFTNGVFLG